MKIIDSIDRSVCMTVDRRFDQACDIQKEGKKYGFDIELYIMGDGKHDVKYDHIDDDELPPDLGRKIPPQCTWYRIPSLYNHWRCEKRVMEKAYDDGCDNIMMFEDDAVFMPNFSEVINKVDNFFMNNEWDIIFIGNLPHGSNKSEKVYEYVNRARSNVAGFHGVLISRKILEKVRHFEPYYIMDDMFRRFINEYKVFRLDPSIIGQRAGYSVFCDRVRKPGEQDRV